MSRNEFYSSNTLLSLRNFGFQRVHTSCQLAQTRMLQFPVCVLLTAFLHTAFCQDGFQEDFRQKQCQGKSTRITKRTAIGCPFLYYIETL